MFSLSAARTAIAQYLERQAIAAEVRRELGVMTDDELNDLGISRHTIARLAREAASGHTHHAEAS